MRQLADGFVRPLRGARVLFRDRTLLTIAFTPVAFLALFCLAGAWLGGEKPGFLHIDWKHFYRTFAYLAPLPTVIMAAYYARLAAAARNHLGHGPVEPCIEPLRVNVSRFVKQALLIFIAVAPLAPVRGIEVVGPLLVKGVAACWALHWIVVDALDSARTLRPGQTPADLLAAAQLLPSPWFVRGLQKLEATLPLGKRLVAKFARILDRLSLPWREEIMLVEAEPVFILGFALATFLLLFTPGLNLLFRPIIVVASVMVLGERERTQIST